MRVACPRRVWSARALCLLAGTALLAGCHKSTVAPPGTPVVTMANLTNSKDFASYIVTIDTITLTSNTGLLAYPLVTPTIVDLVRLNDLTELVEAPAVPSGTYVSATLTLDFSTASVWVNVNGQPELASVLTPAGLGLTAVVVTVTFDPNHPLVITQGVSTRVQVEIDLAASNSIDTTTSSPTVKVQPFIAMRPAPPDATELRARGLFVVTQPSSSNFIMNIRPFYNLVSAVGAVFVNVNASTYYNIEGVTYTGAAGLTALGNELENSAVVVYGTLSDLSGITPYFNATAVYAGSSQESPLAYYATGIVTARTGDTLNLHAIDVLTPLGFTAFYPDLQLTLADTTVVSTDGVATPNLNIDAISVGQRINASTLPTLGSTGNITTLDGTTGHVRLASTPLWGTLNPGATAGQASLCLQSLADYPPSVFNFAGTGAAGQDATANNYQLNTGSFDASSLPTGACGASTGTLLHALGSIAPFGSAPPDFSATLVTAGSATEQQLVVEWSNGPAAATPFSSAGSAGLVVDLTNADLTSIHYIRTGPVTVDLTTLPASPLITTTGADQTQLQLVVGSTTLTTGMSVYSTTAGFAAGLQTALNGTNRIFRLVAYGQYDNNSNTFVATRIHVALYE